MCGIKLAEHATHTLCPCGTAVGRWSGGGQRRAGRPEEVTEIIRANSRGPGRKYATADAQTASCSPAEALPHPYRSPSCPNRPPAAYLPVSPARSHGRPRRTLVTCGRRAVQRPTVRSSITPQHTSSATAGTGKPDISACCAASSPPRSKAATGVRGAPAVLPAGLACAAQLERPPVYLISS